MARIELEIIGNVSGLNKALSDGSKKIKGFAGDTERSLSTISNSFKGIAFGIASAFSVNQIINFTSAVARATAETQKLGAVLTNSLGSSTLAESSMKEIQDFASNTPFGVNELTSAFVKLVNQGFTPTNEQMRQLGDLASSTGKSFDQLTEAIIDAQVGEYERLKEFGVRAADAGNQIIFTFKGVQTTVDKTSSSIRDYLVGLGELEGVTGSMAAISGTLSGQISNLQDNYDQMLISIGNNTSGAFSTAISWVDGLITRIKDLNEEIEISNSFGLSTDFWEKMNRAINPFSDKWLTGRERSVIAIQAVTDWTSKYVQETNSAAKSTEDFDKAIKSIQRAIEATRKEDRPFGEIQGMVSEYTKGIQSLLDLQGKFIENQNKPVDAGFGKKNTEEIENQFISLTKSLNKLNEQSYQQTLTGYNRELRASQNRYDELRKQADEFYKQGALSAKQYQTLLSSIQYGSLAATLGIVPRADGAPIGRGRPNRGPSVFPDVSVEQRPVVDTGMEQSWKAFVDGLDKQLGRAVQSFSRDFLRSIRSLSDQFEGDIGGAFGNIINNLTSGVADVTSSVFSKMLSDRMTSAFSDVDGRNGKAIANWSAGLGLAGSLATGLTRRTNVPGRAIGGAVSGAGAGLATGAAFGSAGGPIGAAIGAVVGAVAGILSASSDNKSVKAQEAQLAEQRKTNALLERQNALAYAPSIIGQMTSGGLVSGITRDAFGQLVATVKGSDLQFVLQRAGGSRPWQ